MKATDPTPAPGAFEFPLPGRQFQRFIFVFHVVFLVALAASLASRWHRPDFAWSRQEIILAALVLTQAGLYLRFFALPHRWPMTYRPWAVYFGLSLSLWFISWRIEPAFEWAILAYLGQMFGVLPARFSLPASSLAFLVYFLSRAGWTRLSRLDWREGVSYLGLMVGWTALGLFIHKLVTTSSERARLIQELEAARKELELARQRDAELAVLRERERLARDLHDSLGHGLVTLTVQLEAAQRLYAVDPARASALLEEMKQLTRTSMEQLRRSLAGLRAPGLGERPLSQALHVLGREVAERTRLTLDCQAPAAADTLPPAVAEALWRVAQEGLANIEKHAHAQTARVSLLLESQQVRLRVCDDGIGLPAEAEARPGHYGLRGLRERIEGLGGEFTLNAVQPHGAQLEARIPLIGT